MLNHRKSAETKTPGYATDNKQIINKVVLIVFFGKNIRNSRLIKFYNGILPLSKNKWYTSTTQVVA